MSQIKEIDCGDSYSVTTVNVWRIPHGNVFRTMLDQHSMAADVQCLQDSSVVHRAGV
jgi:hypothetical protein